MFSSERPGRQGDHIASSSHTPGVGAFIPVVNCKSVCTMNPLPIFVFGVAVMFQAIAGAVIKEELHATIPEAFRQSNGCRYESNVTPSSIFAVCECSHGSATITTTIHESNPMLPPLYFICLDYLFHTECGPVHRETLIGVIETCCTEQEGTVENDANGPRCEI